MVVVAFFIGATWTDHVSLSLNPKDSTCSLAVYGFALKGTYDESSTDYKLYPSLGFMNCPIGPVMEKLDNKSIEDGLIGILKFKENQTNDTSYSIIKFVPEKSWFI